MRLSNNQKAFLELVRAGLFSAHGERVVVNDSFPVIVDWGEVVVGEGTWIGAGTTVIQGIHIGKDCYIGAGSVVVKDILDNSLCYGNPARVIRQINIAKIDLTSCLDKL